MSTITVTFGNSFKGQPAINVPVEEGTTLRKLLETQGGVPGQGASVRLNQSAVESLDTPLTQGDFISVVPVQVKGA